MIQAQGMVENILGTLGLVDIEDNYGLESSGTLSI